MPGGPAPPPLSRCGLTLRGHKLSLSFHPSSTGPAAIFNPRESSRQRMPYGLFVPDVGVPRDHNAGGFPKTSERFGCAGEGHDLPAGPLEGVL